MTYFLIVITPIHLRREILVHHRSNEHHSPLGDESSASHQTGHRSCRHAVIVIVAAQANTLRIPCAKRVTWTRLYAMIRRSKALILLASLRPALEGPFKRNLRIRKPANVLTLRAFGLVAGVGFEPTTFRL